MITFEEIKAAVHNLSISERAEIIKVLQELEEDQWDEQIRQDYDSGKLDSLLNQVREDIRQGRLEDGP